MQKNNQELHELAEDLVMKYEKKRLRKMKIGKTELPVHLAKNKSDASGYDIKSHRRHIEVKSSHRKITWKELTPNETKTYEIDPLYYLYLVEFFEKKRKATITIISKKQLKKATPLLKEIIRFSALTNKEVRKEQTIVKY